MSVEDEQAEVIRQMRQAVDALDRYLLLLERTGEAAERAYGATSDLEGQFHDD